MRRDPELAAAVRDQVLGAKREVLGAVIDRAITRGDIPSDADTALLAEISSAVLGTEPIARRRSLLRAVGDQGLSQAPVPVASGDRLEQISVAVPG